MYTNCVNYKGKLLFRGYTNGRRVSEKIPYRPFLFLPADERTPTSFSTIHGDPVRRKDFSSISEARNFIKDHSEIDGFKFYGITQWEYAYIAEEFPEKVEFDRSLISVVSIDIETWATRGFPDPTKAEEEITLITMRKNGKAYMFGTKVVSFDDENVNYYLCKDEKDLLLKFLDKWEELDADIITGWNIIGFDLPYIINRILKFFAEETVKRLSPWGIIESKEVPTKWGQTFIEYDLVGITCLDYLDLYRKFSYKNQESYKLDFIAEVELDEKKVDYSEYGSLDRLYELNPQKHAEYNLIDVILVDKLDAKLGYINIVLSMAYRAKCNYNDTLRTVKPWDTFIHHTLLSKGQVVCQNDRHKVSRAFVGGHVFEVEPGMYDYVVSFDLKSSYPHQIISYSISPDTLVEKHPLGLDDLEDIVKILDKGGYSNIKTEDELYNSTAMKALQYAHNNDFSMAANGCMFRKDEGFLAKIQSDLFAERARIQAELAELEKEYNEIENELKTRNL